jgi:hypothetical protein
VAPGPGHGFRPRRFATKFYEVYGQAPHKMLWRMPEIFVVRSMVLTLMSCSGYCVPLTQGSAHVRVVGVPPVAGLPSTQAPHMMLLRAPESLHLRFMGPSVRLVWCLYVPHMTLLRVSESLRCFIDFFWVVRWVFMSPRLRCFARRRLCSCLSLLCLLSFVFVSA